MATQLIKFALATSTFLDELADRLDGWARESRSGGWSTHQVNANQSAANDCRRMASELRTVIRDVEDDPS